MGKEQYVLPNPASMSVPAADVDLLLQSGNSDCAMVYLYLHRWPERPIDVRRTGQELGLSDRAVDLAFRQLKKMGLLGVSSQRPAAPADELPEYDADYVVLRSQQDLAFRDLLSEAKGILGRVLSTSDTKTLFGIYDHLGLPVEVIMTMMTALTQEVQEKYGPGRTPTMRAVEKEAYVWARMEIFTMEQAEALLESRARRKETMAQLKRELGIWDRELSATENRYLKDWVDLGFETDAILMAYDRTVTQTGGLKWPYMNKIIHNWHDKGLHTPEEIQAGDCLPSRRKGNQTAGEPPALRSPGGEKESLRKFYESLK